MNATNWYRTLRTLGLLGAAVAISFTASLARAEDEPAGKKVFLDNHCNSCHSVKSASIAVEAADPADAPAEGEAGPPDLSNAGADAKADFMKAYLVKKEMKDGKKHRKKFAGSEEDLGKLVDWVVTLKEAKAK